MTEAEAVAKATRDVIAQSTGSLGYTRGCGINRKLLCTDGIMALAKTAGAYWLIDIVGSLRYDKEVWSKMLQMDLVICQLSVNLEKNTAVFTAREMDAEDAVYEQKMNYTNFPIEEVVMWLDMYSRSGEGEQVLYLPSEH
jgi:hypothetical protein